MNFNCSNKYYNQEKTVYTLNPKQLLLMNSLIRFKQLLGILTYNEYDSVIIKDEKTLNSENLLNTDFFSENHVIENT